MEIYCPALMKCMLYVLWKSNKREECDRNRIYMYDSGFTAEKDKEDVRAFKKLESIGHWSSLFAN